MANLFNSNTSKSTFVEETHGRRGFISYHSSFLGGMKTVEIADLQIITCNRKTNEIRICFVQTKYRKAKFKQFLSIKTNLYQWELLKEKPNIFDTHCNGFPINILNFSSYESITSFGIFYKDKHDEIDFLYTLPKYIHKRSISEIQIMDFKGPCVCPNIHCTKGVGPHETISTCSMDLFEKEVLACRIGAPIEGNIKSYVAGLFKSIRASSSSVEISGILDEFDYILDYRNDNVRDNIAYPNTILILTDGNESPVS